MYIHLVYILFLGYEVSTLLQLFDLSLWEL